MNDVVIDSYEREIKKLNKELAKYQCAIKAITPWLSASLTNECCQEYHNACNTCFEVDTQFKGIYDEM